jgi:hypothetical protein
MGKVDVRYERKAFVHCGLQPFHVPLIDRKPEGYAESVAIERSELSCLWHTVLAILDLRKQCALKHHYTKESSRFYFMYIAILHIH